MRFIGLEKLVVEMSSPAASLTWPATDEEPDWQQVASVGHAYACELLA